LQQEHPVANLVAVDQYRKDNALRVADDTKANPERLGQRGAARLPGAPNPWRMEARPVGGSG
jgi:hypothetical protein